MPFSTLALCAMGLYAVAAIAYVYKWRARLRYAGFGQYLRKSWPLFAPFNCLLYMATRRFARRPVIDAGYLAGISVLRTHWPQIRAEALALHASGELDATSQPGSAGYHDLGFRTFYKRGWKKFYLTWYGAPHRSAQRLCPQTLRLLAQVPGIRGAMFSVLPPGAELSLHADPLACSLRYHLGLATPNDAGCFINVDGHALSWRDGQDFVFDETYPHFARNDTNALRLILMCDVERPMHVAGRAFNRVYALLARALAVPNTAEDRRGLLTGVFATLAPWRMRGLALKARHRSLYLVMKYALNLTLVLLAFLPVYAALQWVERAGSVTLD
ncbi:aspartyl/asparaginyl beta-hydroxylase domain-containing protein [Xanthomonas sp. WHRI 7945]|nr:aspartyl/asparaginyl beta-hydroxylase domain-containing protein [Xanthomonas campestris pv. campestris]